MSRILVADDNSNIQKMVALALKDEGIDVVAVGNGEAAIRRIPDLRPDLVLADVFMPVRNGYELCEFIKSDSRYMSTPVVLLVGAFDPLDEQETQRVRADGVLKKPFVPPDPLINMVKALLAKSNGQKPVMAPVSAKAPEPQPAAPVAPAAPVVPAAPVASASPRSSNEEIPATVTARYQTPAAVKAPPPQSAVTIPEVDDSDQMVTATRDPNLGEPFWATPDETEETEETEETSADDPKDIVDMHSFGNEELSMEPERESVFRPDSPLLDALDSPDDASKTVVSRSQAEAPRQKTPSPSASPSRQKTETQPVEAAPAASEIESAPAPVSESEPQENPGEIFKFDPTLTFATAQSSSEPTADDPAATEPAPALKEKTGTDRPPAETPQSYEPAAPFELELPSLPNREAVISAATEAARLAFSESNTLPSSESAAEASEKHPAEATPREAVSANGPSAVATASPSAEIVEAVVKRLLEQMQPQIMEVVNREVLRPAIEAIVRREMKEGDAK